MMKIRERYDNDPTFRQLVNAMYAYIAQGDTTPTEVREAAMLAQIKYEEHRPRPLYFTKQDVITGKV